MLGKIIRQNYVDVNIKKKPVRPRINNSCVRVCIKSKTNGLEPNSSEIETLTEDLGNLRRLTQGRNCVILRRGRRHFYKMKDEIIHDLMPS